MRAFAVFVLTTVCLAARAQPTADVLEYINTYKQLAIDEMKRTGIPASITIAQGIHETSAGKSELVLKSNNHFGIKCKAYWTGKKVYHDDDARGECFRKYEQPADSYHDHSDFLRGSERYASLFNLDPTDYKAWATGLRKAGYATNPRYAPILIKLIEDYNLQQYTLIALGRLNPSDEILVTLPIPVMELPAPEPPAEEPEVETPAAVVPPPPPPVVYPLGEFSINNTRVVFARQGTSLLSLAQQHDIPLRRLLDFNDLREQDVLDKDQLVYLQRKRKTGEKEFHVVAIGESLHDICQAEAIRLESLLELNRLEKSMQPAVGEKLYLRAMSPSRPKL